MENKKPLKTVWPDCKAASNIIGKDPSTTCINAKVNIRYCMTLNRQSQG